MTSPATSWVLNRHLRRFNVPSPVIPRRGQPPAFGGGGMMTVSVAASNASDRSLSKADFQADGAEDHDKIMAAVDDLPFDGGTCWLSEGDFFPDWDKIVIPQNVTLRGMGKRSTIINMPDDTNPGSAITTGGGGAFATISDLYISMPNSPGASTQHGITVSLDFTTLERVAVSFAQGRAIQLIGALDFTVIRNCFLEFTAGAGIWDDGLGSFVTKIINNTIHAGDGGQYAIEFSAGAEQLTIGGNHISGFGDGGILVTQPNGDGLVIVNNHIEVAHSTNAGIRVDNAGAGGVGTGALIAGNTVKGAGTDGNIHIANMEDVDVVGNVLDNSAGSGIFVTDSLNCLISDNLINQSDEDGIHLTDTDDCIISNNRIMEPSQAFDNTDDGIFLDGTSSRNYIYGNKIHAEVAQSARYGINISASSCVDNRIGDNDYGILADYGTFPLNDAGVGTRYPTARTADMSVTGSLTTGAGVALYPMAEDSIMIDAHPTVGTAPSGGPVTLDINKGTTPVTMYATATNPSIASGTKVGSKAPADPTLFAENDVISLDLDAVNGAADLTCVVRFLVA